MASVKCYNDIDFFVECGRKEMILTEDKIYTMSLETESVNRDSGLSNITIELEFTN